MSVPKIGNCIYCTQKDVDNVERLELAYCMECGNIPKYIPAQQIRNFIRKKYYGDNKSERNIL